MLESFYPDRTEDSTYLIDFEGLYAQGYRGLVFDIDNTLVPHGAPADERSKALFARLKKIGFACVLLSNNKEPRVKMFNDEVHVSYIYKAGKPLKKGYLKAAQMMGLQPEQIVFVGDQLFTDVWGAKAAGMFTYLVKQIDKKEEIQIVLKRKLEKIVLYFYRRSLSRASTGKDQRERDI